ncbi:MAG: polyhydroxyalkanoate synthesis repressor PhaR [Alphaproteobacteria bacterium]
MTQTTPKNQRKKQIIIKKYANRRLYDTGTSSYVTLEDVAQMIRENVDFKVIDSKTKKDLTRSVLTQIIAEKESDEENLLPLDFLRQLIGFYGNGDTQQILSQYLDFSMKQFTGGQGNIGNIVNKSADTNMLSLQKMQDVSKEVNRKNMDLIQQTMEAFNPFFAASLQAQKNKPKPKK